MASDSLSSLKNRKSKVNQDIGNAKQKISAAADKVSRLRTASSSLQTSIHSLRNLKGEVDDLDVSDKKWEGEERKQFDAKHNSYGIFVNVYDSDTSEAQQQLIDDLEAAKQEKAQAEMGLESLQSTLDSLDSDIKAAKEDG